MSIQISQIEHVCDDQTEPVYADVRKDELGWMVGNADAFKFCPFCGFKLPSVDEIVWAQPSLTVAAKEHRR